MMPHITPSTPPKGKPSFNEWENSED